MARTRTRSTIEEKIEAQKLIVSKAKDKYKAAVNELERLMKLRDMLVPIPLLYQTGYLTIADYEKQRKRYTLCFPNEEVKYGFLESLMPSYVPKAVAGTGLDIFTLDDYIENGKVDQVRDVLSRTAK